MMLANEIHKRGNEMTKTEILVKLRNLHEELAAINENCKLSEQVDGATIDALGQIITDAGAILDRYQNGSGSGSSIGNEGETLLERVRSFECEHPLVGRFLNQVSDLLGNMGI
jgi:hypothetical protein